MADGAVAFGGQLRDGRHHLVLRVYYEDTDVGGVVYYANYLKFLERGRSDFLRALGIDQVALMRGEAGEPVTFVARRCEIDYLKPARFDDVIEVVTWVAEARGASAVMGQEVRRDGVVLATALVTIAATGADGRPRPLPRPLRHIFNTLVCR
ncbi:MAG: tol-pal system-associated acyl-CoA thioesterase [Alphaproteobacteria bacterium]|nr:MAG: tol-pal system-associated acyl-CoA thioesterase [Alphaproteobacteria bacterium]